MKSFVAYLLVCSLVGSTICARHRRQAPSAADAPPAAQEFIPEDAATPADTKADGINTALSFILAKLNADAAKGAPLDPKKVDTINKLALIVSVLGGELSEPNKDAIAALPTAPPPAADAPAA